MSDSSRGLVRFIARIVIIIGILMVIYNLYQLFIIG